MKKLMMTLCAAFFALVLLGGGVFAVKIDENTYEITSAEEFKNYSVWKDYAQVRLGADISLPAILHEYSIPFNGTFDGQGHKLEGIFDKYIFKGECNVRRVIFDGSVSHFLGINQSGSIENCISRMTANDTLQLFGHANVYNCINENDYKEMTNNGLVYLVGKKHNNVVSTGGVKTDDGTVHYIQDTPLSLHALDFYVTYVKPGTDAKTTLAIALELNKKLREGDYPWACVTKNGVSRIALCMGQFAEDEEIVIPYATKEKPAHNITGGESITYMIESDIENYTASTPSSQDDTEKLDGNGNTVLIAYGAIGEAAIFPARGVENAVVKFTPVKGSEVSSIHKVLRNGTSNCVISIDAMPKIGENSTSASLQLIISDIIGISNSLITAGGADNYLVNKSPANSRVRGSTQVTVTQYPTLAAALDAMNAANESYNAEVSSDIQKRVIWRIEDGVVKADSKIKKLTEAELRQYFPIDYPSETSAITLPQIYFTFTFGNVDFELNGGALKNAPTGQLINQKLDLTKLIPSKSGAEFIEWCTDENLTKPAGESIVVGLHTKLYAKWSDSPVPRTGVVKIGKINP